ncbi:2Fe-2S iron-sulfur cluster-binding protein [Oceanobacter mangrovi]|uniref:2Fe-2S iron-sulfur cluster-binding protein n=1 Tax=Oceanobacter mangrovi TaxID=2862510 RepID=UPI001C8E2690|nr:2Fe-2S iron-sulfur cluster-binding protein [Oceanobacter mangrovi]
MKHAIRIAGQEGVFWCDENDSILSGLMKSNSRGIQFGCRGGGCGVCKVQILSGSFETRCMSGSQVTAVDRQENKLLACRVYPRSNIELIVIGKVIKRCQSAA